MCLQHEETVDHILSGCEVSVTLKAVAAGTPVPGWFNHAGLVEG